MSVIKPPAQALLRTIAREIPVTRKVSALLITECVKTHRNASFHEFYIQPALLYNSEYFH